MGGEPDIYYIVIYVKFAGVGFPGGSVVKNPSASAGDMRDTGSVPSREDPPEKGVATHSSILAWRIPQTEEPGGLRPIGPQRLQRTRVKRLSTHAQVMQNAQVLSIHGRRSVRTGPQSGRSWKMGFQFLSALACCVGLVSPELVLGVGSWDLRTSGKLCSPLSA